MRPSCRQLVAGRVDVGRSGLTTPRRNAALHSRGKMVAVTAMVDAAAAAAACSRSPSAPVPVPPAPPPVCIPRCWRLATPVGFLSRGCFRAAPSLQ